MASSFNRNSSEQTPRPDHTGERARFSGEESLFREVLNELRSSQASPDTTPRGSLVLEQDDVRRSTVEHNNEEEEEEDDDDALSGHVKASKRSSRFTKELQGLTFDSVDDDVSSIHVPRNPHASRPLSIAVDVTPRPSPNRADTTPRRPPALQPPPTVSPLAPSTLSAPATVVRSSTSVARRLQCLCLSFLMLAPVSAPHSPLRNQTTAQSSTGKGMC
jgi:hypothetical protein